MLKDWIRYLIIFVVLAIAVCVALPQFYPEPPKKTWNDLEWFSFVASVLTIVGLVIAWTELKSNSKIIIFIKIIMKVKLLKRRKMDYWLIKRMSKLHH